MGAFACTGGAPFGSSGPSSIGDLEDGGETAGDGADDTAGMSDEDGGSVGVASKAGGDATDTGVDSTAGADDDDDDDDDMMGSTGMGMGVDPGSTGAAGDSEGGAGGESSGGEAIDATPTLLQAAYNASSGDYEFGFAGLDEIPITGGPADVDWSRWAMLHDGSVYRLYFMRDGTDDALYQFGFNGGTNAYEYGHQGLPLIPIVGAPADADTSSFAMLHQGANYKLYFLSESLPRRVYQFGFNPSTDTYEYGYLSTPQIPVTGTPASADFSGWAMLFSGEFKVYAFGSAAHSSLAQHEYNPGTGAYEYGYTSTPIIDLAFIPADANTDDFAMLHDGEYFRLYFLSAP